MGKHDLCSPLCVVKSKVLFEFYCSFEVLANMLKTVLEKVISRSQNACIRVRHILDSSWLLMNALIAELDQGILVFFVNWT